MSDVGPGAASSENMIGGVLSWIVNHSTVKPTFLYLKTKNRTKKIELM